MSVGVTCSYPIREFGLPIYFRETNSPALPNAVLMTHAVALHAVLTLARPLAPVNLLTNALFVLLPFVAPKALAALLEVDLWNFQFRAHHFTAVHQRALRVLKVAGLVGVVALSALSISGQPYCAVGFVLVATLAELSRVLLPEQRHHRVIDTCFALDVLLRMFVNYQAVLLSWGLQLATSDETVTTEPARVINLCKALVDRVHRSPQTPAALRAI